MRLYMPFDTCPGRQTHGRFDSEPYSSGTRHAEHCMTIHATHERRSRVSSIWHFICGIMTMIVLYKADRPLLSNSFYMVRPDGTDRQLFPYRILERTWRRGRVLRRSLPRWRINDGGTAWPALMQETAAPDCAGQDAARLVDRFGALHDGHRPGRRRRSAAGQLTPPPNLLRRHGAPPVAAR